MDEKKLKKLSRLEILELLFEVSKENEQLREENKEIKGLLGNKSSDSKNVDALISHIKTLEEAILEIKEITAKYPETVVKYPEAAEKHYVKEVPSCAEMFSSLSEREKPMADEDRQLFNKLLDFFEEKTFVACIMDKDLKNELFERINKK